MDENPTSLHLTTITSTNILLGLRNNDANVWRTYVDRYRPLLLGYARKLGLSDHDADDVAQQTLAAFCKAYQDGKYDRERGRLRVWLFAIARNQIITWHRRKRGREVQVAGEPDRTGFFESLDDENRMEQQWDQEWREAVMQQCLAEIRLEVEPRTFEAFELFAAKGLPAEKVAEQLGMTATAVFGAKRRILRRVRELLPQIEENW